MSLAWDASTDNSGSVTSYRIRNNQGYEDGSRELLVTWTASNDNVSEQSMIRYDVFVNGVLTDGTAGTPRSDLYGVAGNNVITVIAVDEAGNKSTAGTVTIVIP